MPNNASFGKLLYQFRVFSREVLGFASILFHVEKFGLSPAVFAKEFPFTFPYS